MTAAYDVVVIGSGPAGHAAAVEAAQLGAQVAVVEQDQLLGGRGVHRWWLPIEHLRRADGVGAGAELSRLLPDLDQRRSEYAATLRQEFASLGIARIHARARLADTGTVALTQPDGGARTLSSGAVVIATGDQATGLLGKPLDHEFFLDSWSALASIYVPETLLVVGASLMAAETASLFAALGTQVTWLCPPGGDLGVLPKEARSALMSTVSCGGGEVVDITSVTRARRKAGRVALELDLPGAGSRRVVRADRLVVAHGRTAQTHRLGLSDLGVSVGAAGHVAVSCRLESSVRGVFAAGAVVAPLQAPGVAAHQGRQAARAATGSEPTSEDTLQYAVLGVPCVAGRGRVFAPDGGRIERVELGETIRTQVLDEAGAVVGVHAVGPDALALLTGGVVEQAEVAVGAA